MGRESQDFGKEAARALADPALQKALLNVRRGFVAKRTAARAAEQSDSETYKPGPLLQRILNLGLAWVPWGV